MKQQQQSGPGDLKALFIGNSFTARNNVPGLITSLAAARGRKLDWKLISAGGASLRMHWNKGDAGRAISADQYDYVVLQEQSTLPVKNATRMHENIRLFDELVKQHGAETVLYLTWARQHEPHNQALITKAYTTIGSELGAKIAPVGVAWERLIAKDPALLLHDADKSHPTLAGSYLAACVFLKVLFGEDAVGIESNLKGLSAAEVLELQRAAKAIKA